jgi:hypothetical protein
MKHAVLKGSGAILTKFHKDWFRYSKADTRDTQTQGQHDDYISLLSFFQNKGSRLKI